MDEALRHQDPSNSLQGVDRIDPPLTPQGHFQAHLAFSNFSRALAEDGKRRKIAFFCSPTKRTIGTALMTSSATRILRERSDLFDLNFSIQQREGNEESSDCNGGIDAPTNLDRDDCAAASNDTVGLCAMECGEPIPITVLNGLSSCAARVNRCGGGDAATKEGHLPCADLAANNGSSYSPMSIELEKMRERCRQVLSHTKNSTNNSSRVATDTVRFGKIDKKTGVWLPMSAPVTALSFPELQHNKAPNNYTTLPLFNEDAVTFPGDCLDRGNEGFLEAVDRAVCLAYSKGCNTVVLVSHREGIRELLDRWGNNGFNVPRRFSYCCIASFKAKVLQEKNTVRWCFHGVREYDDFDVTAVPNKERWTQRLTECVKTEDPRLEDQELEPLETV